MHTALREDMPRVQPCKGCSLSFYILLLMVLGVSLTNYHNYDKSHENYNDLGFDWQYNPQINPVHSRTFVVNQSRVFAGACPQNNEHVKNA